MMYDDSEKNQKPQMYVKDFLLDHVTYSSNLCMRKYYTMLR